MENFSNSRSAAQRYMPKRNFAMKAVMFLLLVDAFLSCRLSTSGFQAMHIAAVQATRATYLEKWASMSEISIIAATVNPIRLQTYGARRASQRSAGHRPQQLRRCVSQCWAKSSY